MRPAISARSIAQFTPEQLKEALRRMCLIRRFEEGAEEAYMRGLIHGTMHLSIGQEASAVGSTMALRKTDYITSTHRGHGHCIGKGADPKLMFAEFFGKEEGYCRGRGGSMHIADVESGNLGANGIVAGGIPIAVGAALAIKKQKRDDVALCFFGDGATNEGAFHEALNMASIWKLPVIFVCENNKYGMSVSTERSMAVANVADRASRLQHAGRYRRWKPDRGCGRSGFDCHCTGPAKGRGQRWLNARPTAPAAIPGATATAIAARKRSKNGNCAIPLAISKPSLSPSASQPKMKSQRFLPRPMRKSQQGIEFATQWHRPFSG